MRAVSEGLKTTFRVLAETDTEAAGRLLIWALDCSFTGIREAALVAALRRRDPAAQQEILRRWDALGQRFKAIVRQHRGRMNRALRDAIVGNDQQMCANACNAALWFQEYDLIPALLTALNDQFNPSADLAATTLLGLVDQLYEELAGPHDDRGRDPELIRHHVVSSLELSVQRFLGHKRREVIEGFLLLAHRDNQLLRQILQDPHHGSFLVMVDVLLKSSRSGVIRLLLEFIDDPRAPSAALSVVGHRCDLTFVRCLLRKIGRESSNVVRQNLKRIVSIAWLRTSETYLDQLDDVAQHAAVQLVMASGLPRVKTFSTIEYLVRHGKAAGRRAAAEALSEFNGAEANALALQALKDPDPMVQAKVVTQLRRRGIPGMLGRLVDLLESPHAVVRQAARKSLAEFTFKRFVGAFDMLDDDVRRSTGMLVRKIDPQTISQLRGEMRSRVRTRRLRALAIARTIDVVPHLEPVVIELLNDEDHLVRVEAAVTLASCNSEASRRSLHEALFDHSTAVQEAAKRSLGAREQFTEWRTSFADPRD